jgi:hypothetical protein
MTLTTAAPVVARHHLPIILGGIRPAMGEMTVDHHLYHDALVGTRPVRPDTFAPSSSPSTPANIRSPTTLAPGPAAAKFKTRRRFSSSYSTICFLSLFSYCCAKKLRAASRHATPPLSLANPCLLHASRIVTSNTRLHSHLIDRASVLKATSSRETDRIKLFWYVVNTLYFEAHS